jgi:hypothetical protein
LSQRGPRIAERNPRPPITGTLLRPPVSQLVMKPLLLTLALAVLLHAADDPKTEIKKTITAAFKSMQIAKTKDDIARAVDGIDLPEWVSIGPDGQSANRAGALHDLETHLAVPPEKRSSPHVDFIWWNETPSKTMVLYWVYDEHEGVIVGAIIRDTWLPTRAGWRRSMHEKLFPNRPLIDHGKPVILPPLPDHIP